MAAEDDKRMKDTQPEDDFAAEAEGDSSNIFVEFKDFLLHNKKWWLLPIVLVLCIVAIFVLLGNSPLAPLLYTFW